MIPCKVAFYILLCMNPLELDSIFYFETTYYIFICIAGRLPLRKMYVSFSILPSEATQKASYQYARNKTFLSFLAICRFLRNRLLNIHRIERNTFAEEFILLKTCEIFSFVIVRHLNYFYNSRGMKNNNKTPVVTNTFHHWIRTKTFYDCQNRNYKIRQNFTPIRRPFPNHPTSRDVED